MIGKKVFTAVSKKTKFSSPGNIVTPLSGILVSLAIAAICLGILAHPLRAQSYLYDTWGIKDGLPQNTVTKILQTSDGYIWVATEGGLARFDGVKFTVFNTQNTPALKSNRINALAEAKNGDLVIAATESGLTVYRDGIFMNMSDSLGYRPHSYFVLWADSKGRLLGRVSGKGDLYTHAAHTYIKTEGPDVSRFFLKDEGDYRFSLDSTLFFDPSSTEESERRIKIDQTIYEVAPGKETGEFWLLTDEGICYYHNFERSKCIDLNDNKFMRQRTKFAYTTSKIYIGSYSPEVLVFNKSSFSYSILDFNEVCADGILEDVYEDREGNIWYGSTTCGLIKVKPDRFRYIDQSHEMKGGNIYPIAYTDDKMIWTGSREKGVLLYDSLFNPQKLPDELLVTAYATSIEHCDGNLYFYYISRDYVQRWDGENSSRIPFPDGQSHSTEALFCSEKDGLIVGSRDGIFKLNEEYEMIKHPLSDLIALPEIVSMLEDTEGRLWVVGNTGVVCCNTEKKEIVYRFGENDEAVRYYRGIEESVDGRIFVGSYGNGLMVIENGEMRRVTTDQGLVENVISSITFDGNGNIWLTGNKGLSRITDEELAAVLDGRLEKLSVIFYDEQTDGLRTGEFNGGILQSKCHLGENRYLFPTLKGAVCIDFDKMMFNELPPPVNVEKVIYGDSILFANDRLSMPYSAERMELHYTALSFSSPQNVRFKYRLAGYEKEWTNAGTERKTSYSKLPPGEYDFQVIACNNEGVWNETGDRLNIEIVPPFYMTTWFKISMVLIGLLLVALITVGVIRRNKKMLMEKQRMRLEAIVNTEERERHRIAKDLHDGVGQLLSSVKMNLTNTESGLEDKHTAAILSQSKKDIDQITTELRNISYNLLPSSLDKFGLAPAMEEQINKLQDGSDINFHFNNSAKQERFDPKIEITLYRVFQEMLNNSLKHSSASEITVQLLQFGKELQLMFEDNGKGFNLKSGLEKTGSSGLKNLYSRVALINGNMVIDSHPNSGTVIIVEVKL